MNKWSISALFAVSIMVLVGTIPLISESVTSVHIQNVSIGSGAEITIPIIIEDANYVKGAYINMSYNPSVVHVKSIGNSDFTLTSYRNINNKTGHVGFAVI